MKRLLIQSVFLFILLFNSSGQTIVYLQARYSSNLLNLDSIIVENTTNYNKISFAVPQQISTYAIDLVNGILINGFSDGTISPNDASLLVNKPGRSTILFDLLHRETVNITLHDIAGRLENCWHYDLQSGINRIDLDIGKSELFVCNIQSKSITFRFLTVGLSTKKTSCSISNQDDRLKSNPLFTFQPGDSVRFTAYKSGMYRNSSCFAPQNGDTTVVYLSIPCPDSPVIYDYDGNKYSTVLINGRCWMRENMRTKHYANGLAIEDGTGKGDISSDYFTKYWFDWNDDPSFSEVYGRYYTAPAALNGVFDRMTQGLCPNGWHVSTNAEWCEMEQAFDTTVTDCSIGEGYLGAWVGTNIFPKLAETGTSHWNFWGLPAFSTNESGFSGIGGGWRESDGHFYGLNVNGLYWMSRVLGQQGTIADAPSTALSSASYSVFRMWHSANEGYSVRCVKDD